MYKLFTQHFTLMNRGVIKLFVFSFCFCTSLLAQPNENEENNNDEPDDSTNLLISQTASAPQIISGPKFRKIGLNGVPLADEKPQSKDESDYIKEETYVDALTLQLNHSTTDLYIPVPGSDLALSVRRNVTGAVARDLRRTLVHMGNDPSQVFGAGWTSNLGSHVRLEVTVSASEESAALERYAHVTDENGASHRFAVSSPVTLSLPNGDSWKSVPANIVNTGHTFYPLPADKHSLDTLQSSLVSGVDTDGAFMIFTKKYGTKLRYEKVSYELNHSYLGHNKDREEVSRTTSRAVYYRLVSVEDRYGNGLKYIFYTGNNSLIPNEIMINDDSDQTLKINFNTPSLNIETSYITSIQYPKDGGQVTNYTYDSVNLPYVFTNSNGNYVLGSTPLLTEVKRPSVNGGRPTTQYEYNNNNQIDTSVDPNFNTVDMQLESTPVQLLSYNQDGVRVPVPSYHLNLSRITDSNNNTYKFSYGFDFSSKTYARKTGNEDPDDDYVGYYSVPGKPRMIEKVTLPGSVNGSREVTFVAAGILQYYPRFLLSASPLSGGEIFNATVGSASGSRVITVGAAEGMDYIYTFSNPKIYPMSESKLEIEEPSEGSIDMQAPPVFAAYTEMTLTMPEFGEESVEYDFTKGLAPINVNDFSGNITSYEYEDNAVGTNPKIILSAGGSFIIPGGSKILERNSDPTAEINAYGNPTYFDYDLNNYYAMTKFTDELGQFTETPVESTYGRRTDEKKYDSSENLIQHTEFDYDTTFLGVLTKKTVKKLPGDPTWTEDLITEYELYGASDPNGTAGLVKKEIVDPLGENLVTEYTYDLNGNKTSVKDPRGNTTYYVYDAINRLTDVVYPPATSATDSSAPRAKYVYDLRSNKVGVIDENENVTVFKYDEFNRLIRKIRVMGSHSLNVSDPDTFINYSPAGIDLVTKHTYNLVNSKTSTTDPNGNTTYFYYDSINRLIGQKEPAVEVFDPVTGQTGTRNPITWFYYGDNCGGSIFNTDGFKPTHTIDSRGYLTVVEYDDLYRPVNTATQFTGTTVYSTDPTVFPIPEPSLPTFTTTPDANDNYAQTVNHYDAVGNLRFATDDLGRTTETRYDGMNRPVKVINPDLSEQEIAYTSTGLQYEMIDELDRVTSTEYDNAGRPVKVIQPEVHNALTGLPDTPVTETVYDDNGNVIQTTNPLNQIWDFEFDERNRQTKEIQPSVAYIDHVYNASTDTWDAVTGTDRPEILTRYDDVGNQISVTDARGQVSYTLYDQANRPTTTITPEIEVYDVATDSTQTIHSASVTIYDENGNIDKQQIGSISTAISDYEDALAATITIERTQIDNTWDAFNRLTSTIDAENITVTNKYDARSNRTAVIDGEGQRTEFDYDGLARNTVTRHHDLTEKVLTFNALVQTQRTDEMGKETTYTYDSRNRLDQVDYADDAVIDRDYTYDLVGNILSVDEIEDYQDAAYTYDALNRILTETSGGITHSYGYDLAGNRITTAYGDGLGGAELALVSTYDALNRTATIFEDDNANGTHDSGERISGYQYDLNGNIRLKDQLNGDSIRKIYDTLGRTLLITGPEGGDSLPLYEYTQQYDLFANLTRIDESYPSSDSNLVARTIVNVYDNIDRLANEVISTSTETVTTTYGYDDAHNRIRKEVADGKVINSVTTNTDYSYSNSLNQITAYYVEQQTRAHSSALPTVADMGSVTFEYDLNGNRKTSTRKWRGNTIHEKQTLYIYDYENRIRELHEIDDATTVPLPNPGETEEDAFARIADSSYSYGYDYRTRRTLRDESGAGGETTYLSFSGGTSAQEFEEDGTTIGFTPGEDALQVGYVRGSDYGGGIGGILYTLRSGVASVKHYNSRGDVVAAVDGSGTLTYQAAYEAFGKHGDTPSSEEWGSTTDRQQANTKDEDPTGLLNEGFRYRDLETGTFITRDPLGFVDGPNVYTYVVQNPWTYFDPLGLFGYTETGWDVANVGMGYDSYLNNLDQGNYFSAGLDGLGVLVDGVAAVAPVPGGAGTAIKAGRKAASEAKEAAVDLAVKAKAKAGEYAGKAKAKAGELKAKAKEKWNSLFGKKAGDSPSGPSAKDNATQGPPDADINHGGRQGTMVELVNPDGTRTNITKDRVKDLEVNPQNPTGKPSPKPQDPSVPRSEKWPSDDKKRAPTQKEIEILDNVKDEPARKSKSNS